MPGRIEAAPFVLSSVLMCCDMTTSPDGELVPVERRLAVLDGARCQDQARLTASGAS